MNGDRAETANGMLGQRGPLDRALTVGQKLPDGDTACPY